MFSRKFRVMNESDVTGHNRMRASLSATAYIVRRIVVTVLKRWDRLIVPPTTNARSLPLAAHREMTFNLCSAHASSQAVRITLSRSATVETRTGSSAS